MLVLCWPTMKPCCLTSKISSPDKPHSQTTLLCLGFLLQLCNAIVPTSGKLNKKCRRLQASRSTPAATHWIPPVLSWHQHSNISNSWHNLLFYSINSSSNNSNSSSNRRTMNMRNALEALAIIPQDQLLPL